MRPPKRNDGNGESITCRRMRLQAQHRQRLGVVQLQPAIFATGTGSASAAWKASTRAYSSRATSAR